MMGKVQILPELNLKNPLNTGTLSANRKVQRKLVSATTAWPQFVYDQYEPYKLMADITRHLENWVTFEAAKRADQPKPDLNQIGEVKNTIKSVSTGTSSQGASIRTTRTVTTVVQTVEVNTDDESSEDEVFDEQSKSSKTKAPNKPCEFSFWVAANLPLEDAQRVRLLSLSCSIQRLRWLQSMLTKYCFLCCENCKVRICHRDDVFSMSASGPQAAYVNPAGMVHETLTIMRATSLSMRGRPSTEFSWFPGYAWTICECSQCHAHIGWRFTCHIDKKLQPEQFWGITRQSVELGLKTDAGEGLQDGRWRPVI